jgi:hypothetical protein
MLRSSRAFNEIKRRAKARRYHFCLTLAACAFDQRQRGTFNESFERYVSTRVGAGRINTGRGC